jgi:catechol 2,3-dioxygenase-like lactoylglutathione lyase family enzyme
MSRIQLALNVDDIDAATAFYAKLFGTEPAKTRPGYANFAIPNPPLKLVLLENPGQGGTLNHLGVEGAPNGERWEVCTVLADSTTFCGEPPAGPACCAGDAGEARPAASENAGAAFAEPAAACC